MKDNDSFNLSRFVDAQQGVYETVLQELQNGRKETHWMWFVFPQLKELGRSSTALFYGINGFEEAQAYLLHPVLRVRLEQCLKAVLLCTAKEPIEIFGQIDSLKFQSCLTLFALAAPENTLFQQALEKYYRGIRDKETEKLIAQERKKK